VLRSTDELPGSLKRLQPRVAEAMPVDSGPRILYPPSGGELELGPDGEILLEISGGQGPFHWLREGRYIGAIEDRRFPWRPTTDGAVHLAVLDSAGRSDRVSFQVVMPLLSPDDPAGDPPTGTASIPRG